MMQEQTNEAVQTLDLNRIWKNFCRILRRTWWLALLLAALIGGYRYYQSWKNFRPLYTASASFSVKSSFISTTDLIDTTQYYNSQATEQVVSSFPYIIRSEAMQERIRLALNTGWINGSIQATAVEGTNLFTLSVTSTDPQDAYNILNAVIENYPQVASFVIGDTVLSMIEQPVVPSTPVNTFQGTQTALKGGLFGLLLGLAVTMLLALARKTVQTDEDLKHFSSVQYLGALPYIHVKRRRTATGNGISVLNERLGDTLSAPVNALQVRLLRTKLESDGARVILVTSTMPGEGKTTVSFNLAASLAKSGKQVILVDADLRHQVLKSRFGIHTPSAGLLELSRAAKPDVARVLISVGDTTLKLLAGDKRVASPMSILDSAKMRNILRQTRSLADYVIVDAPPAGMLADAAVLCRSADQVLYVVQYDGVSVGQIVDSMYSLSAKGAELAGYVINGRPARQRGYGKYGYGYGRYGYGRYGYGKSNASEEKRKHTG